MIEMATPMPSDEFAGEKPFSRDTGLRVRDLQKAIRRSYEGMEWWRRLNKNMVAEYAGPGYGESTLHDKPANKLKQAIKAYVTLLAANRPTVEMRAMRPQLEAFANTFEFAINDLVKEIGLEYTLRRWMLDALLNGHGVVKVHLADAGPVQFETDIWMDPGVVFASNVSCDDYVVDMSAKKDSEAKFKGDMYRIPFADLEQGIEDGIYLPHAEEIRPSSKMEVSGDRAEDISRGTAVDEDEFEPMVDLADVWVPRDGMIYTFPVKQRREFVLYGEPIAEMEWNYDHGPYVDLVFEEVPDNILGASFAQELSKLDRMINSLMRKADDQADRQKEILGYTPAGAQTTKNVVRASDGDSVLMESTSEAKVFQFGGVNPGNQAFTSGLMDLFDMQAGNLTALLGLGSQAETLGQEQLIHQAGSRMVGQMQYRMVDATTRLVKTLGFMLWYDEFKTITGQWEVPGTDGVSVTMQWEPGDREGNLLDYEFEIGVYSMQYRPPSARVQSMNALLQQVHIPLYEAIASQGGAIDFQALNDIYAKDLDLPDMRKVITWANPRPQDEGDPRLSLRKPNSSTRTYIRKGQSSRPETQNNVEQQQAWLSAAGKGNQGQPRG